MPALSPADARVARAFPSYRDFVDDALFHPSWGYYSTGVVRFGEGGHYDTFPTALNVNERIDYVFLVPPGGASPCSGTLDSPADADGDGVGTRLFAAQPNPFATCGPLPAPMCWVSDHDGVEADVNCS